MTASTPGPWKLDTDGRVRDAIGRYIADVGDGLEISDAEANARLIAAAPELLAGCVAMLGHMESGFLLRNTASDPLRSLAFVRDLQAMHAALAKATGATS